MIITNHATQRGKERVVHDTKGFERLSAIAWEKGHKMEDFKEGKMKRFLFDAYASHQGKAGGLRIYGEFLYVFSYGGILITVLHLPTTHRNYKPYLKNEQKN